MIKKQLIILFTITNLLVACKKETLNNDNEKIIHLNPPTWIQGTWLTSTNGFTEGFKFIYDDVIVISGNNENSTKSVYTGDAKFVENIISNTYKYSVIVSGNNIPLNHFNKIDATHIKRIDPDDGAIIETLTKQ